MPKGVKSCRYPHLFQRVLQKHGVFNIWCRLSLKSTAENIGPTPAPPRPHPGFTPGEPRFGNYSGKQHGVSAPPGFMPGVRRFENSHSRVVKPRLYRRKAQSRGVKEFQRRAGYVSALISASFPTNQGINIPPLALSPRHWA